MHIGCSKPAVSAVASCSSSSRRYYNLSLTRAFAQLTQGLEPADARQSPPAAQFCAQRRALRLIASLLRHHHERLGYRDGIDVRSVRHRHNARYISASPPDEGALRIQLANLSTERSS
jgi:hypothetical protein